MHLTIFEHQNIRMVKFSPKISVDNVHFMCELYINLSQIAIHYTMMIVVHKHSKTGQRLFFKQHYLESNEKGEIHLFPSANF